MEKKKKVNLRLIFMCLLMFAFVMASLMGCSGVKNQTADKSDQSTNSPAKKPEKLTITAMVRSFDVTMPDPKDDFIKQAIEEKFNVDLKIEPVLDAQLKQKAGAYFASGSFPDVVAFRGFEAEFVKQGLFIPLDDYLNELPKFTQNWPQSAREQWTNAEDNKVYGLPEIRLSVMDNLWIRKDWLDKLKIPVPQNMQEVADAAEAFAKRDPDGNGKPDTFGYFLAADGGKGIAALAVFERYFGTQFNQPYLLKDGTIEFSQFSQDNYAALKFLKEQFIDRSMDPNWFFAKPADQQNMLQTGRIGIVASKVDFYKYTNAYTETKNPIPGNWIPLPDIKDPSGKQTKFDNSGYGQRTFFLTKGVSKEKADRFMQILEWMATPGEGYDLITYGREGIDYEKKDGKIIAKTNPNDPNQLWRDNYRWYYDDKDPYWMAGLPKEIVQVQQKMIDRFNSKDYDKKSVSNLLDNQQGSYENYTIADFNRFYNAALFEFLLNKRSFDQWDAFKKEGYDKFHYQEYVDHNTARFKEKLGLK